jgi:hypothetical protein
MTDLLWPLLAVAAVCGGFLAGLAAGAVLLAAQWLALRLVAAKTPDGVNSMRGVS